MRATPARTHDRRGAHSDEKNLSTLDRVASADEGSASGSGRAPRHHQGVVARAGVPARPDQARPVHRRWDDGADPRPQPVRAEPARVDAGRPRHPDRSAAEPAVRRRRVQPADAALRRAAAPADRRRLERSEPDAARSGADQALEHLADGGRSGPRRRLGPDRRPPAGGHVGAPALGREQAARRRRRVADGRMHQFGLQPRRPVVEELGDRMPRHPWSSSSIRSCRRRTATRCGLSTARFRRSC